MGTTLGPSPYPHSPDVVGVGELENLGVPGDSEHPDDGVLQMGLQGCTILADQLLFPGHAHLSGVLLPDCHLWGSLQIEGSCWAQADWLVSAP